MASEVKSQVKCPRCQTDVMVTGFTLRFERSDSYMQFDSKPCVIASTQKAARRAECMQCGAVLAQAPAELLKRAA